MTLLMTPPWLHYIHILVVRTWFFVFVLAIFSCGFKYYSSFRGLMTNYHVSDVDDTHNRLAFLDGGAIFNLPMFYLEGTYSNLFNDGQLLGDITLLSVSPIF